MLKGSRRALNYEIDKFTLPNCESIVVWVPRYLSYFYDDNSIFRFVSTKLKLKLSNFLKFSIFNIEAWSQVRKL
jgi:hypothetical protein